MITSMLAGAMAIAAEQSGDFSAQPTRRNVLFIVVDNMRPALGAYGISEARTPNMDNLAASGTLFTRAYCQEAWCSPSRNSFLSGRRPMTTKAWNFLDSFRENADGSPGPGADWVTLPGYFKAAGYYTTSSGKVFHNPLPANMDFPHSWSDMPVLQNKSDCRDKRTATSTMACLWNFTQIPDSEFECANLTIARLQAWHNGAQKTARKPFFSATGFQGPRLSWAYPDIAAARLPPAEMFPTAAHPQAPAGHDVGADWFRPAEVAWYEDVKSVGGLSHDRPLPRSFEQRLRRAYYATIAHVDDQVGLLLSALKKLDVDDETVVILTADHGQNLGENNLWSMMSLFETSLRVPLVIRPAPADGVAEKRRYDYPVELVDLFPTLVDLAHLPPPPSDWDLPGDSLAKAMQTGSVVKRVNAAFGEITRCRNCSLAYIKDKKTYMEGCAADSIDAYKFYVPCAQTSRALFDYMGMTVRTSDWRYSLFCRWNGDDLTPDLNECGWHELYDHRNDTQAYNVDHNGESLNLAGDPSYRKVQYELHAMILSQYKPVGQ